MITVKICVGTACYIMGGANLLGIKDELTTEELEQINIEGSNCLGLCKGYNPATPYVMINDEVIEEASQEIILMKLRSMLSSKE